MPKEHHDKELEFLEKKAKEFAPKEAPKNTYLFYFQGLVTATLPAVLFAAQWELDFLYNLPVFLGMIIFSAYTLSQSYETVFESKFNEFRNIILKRDTEAEVAKKLKGKTGSDGRPLDAKTAKAEKDAEVDIATAELEGEKKRVALAYALCSCNVIFLGAILVMCFSFLKQIEPAQINYVISSLAAALVTYLLATESSKLVKKRLKKAKKML